MYRALLEIIINISQRVAVLYRVQQRGITDEKQLFARTCVRNDRRSRGETLKRYSLASLAYKHGCLLVAFEGTSRQAPLKRNARGTISFPHVQLAPHTRYQFHRRGICRSAR